MDAATPKNERSDRQPGQRGRHADSNNEEGRAESKDRKNSDNSEKTERSEKSEKPKPSLWERAREHPWVLIGAAIALVVLLLAVLLWWLHARHYESTDDAFIDTRTATISPQVSGSIASVIVTDNQVVQAGDVLVLLDDTTFRAQLTQAKAQVDQAVANIANLGAQMETQQTRIDQAQKQMTQTQAALTFAQQEFNRAQTLANTNSGTIQQVQQTQSNLKQSEANLGAAEANVTASIKQLTVLRTQREAADAQLESARAQQVLAQTNLGYTKIVAPIEGRVTKLTAAVGSYVALGQALMMFVPQRIWITANFKETQLAYMRPGQPVDISIDAYPSQSFHGHVESIQAGSGTAFSLLPAENATGNYVKVVQRVPVKIVFDNMPGIELGPGMSVVPTVKVR